MVSFGARFPRRLLYFLGISVPAIQTRPLRGLEGLLVLPWFPAQRPLWRDRDGKRHGEMSSMRSVVPAVAPPLLELLHAIVAPSVSEQGAAPRIRAAPLVPLTSPSLPCVSSAELTHEFLQILEKTPNRLKRIRNWRVRLRPGGGGVCCGAERGGGGAGLQNHSITEL